ncbi:MAG: HAMP domain-containing histidine kinase, partial [Leptospiraceae bacterium]|nr:HAMP domain-containing histidine kinase [Leptospiraceae bacterium]
LEYHYQKEQERIQSLYAAEKLKAQIEWLNYKESARIRDAHHSTLRNLHDMKNSFLEGASIGSMMTMIYMIRDTMQPTENGYLVDKGLLETLIECNEVCNHQFEGIYNITQTLENEIHLKEMTCDEFNQKVAKWIEPILPHFTRKNVSVTYPTLHSKAIIEVDEVAFVDVVQELLFNAYKYTIPNSTINVFAFISEGYMILTVKNDVSENPYSGIPKEYEKILIEPFIRLHTNDEHIIKVEKFGLGLGLTVVDNIIKKHNGMFFIHDVVDYTTTHKKLCVAAEVFLPIKKK